MFGATTFSEVPFAATAVPQGPVVVFAAVSEFANASENVVVVASIFSSIANESATQTDAVDSSRTTNTIVSEAAQGIDAVQVGASTFGAIFAEIVRALDASQGANTGASALSESVTASATESVQFVPATAVNEQATVQDSVSTAVIFIGVSAESIVVLDQNQVAPSTFSAVILAVVQVSDSGNPAGSIYNATLPVESVLITDGVTGAFLWNEINTAQNPTWINIDTF